MVDTAVFGSRGARLVSAESLIESLTGEVRPAILVFLAAVGLLFLTAIAISRASSSREPPVGVASLRSARHSVPAQGVWRANC